jgi:hypothetical protein
LFYLKKDHIVCWWLKLCATQGASATTRWPIAAIASSSTSAELTAGVGEKTSLTTGETTTEFCKSRGNSAGIASTGTNTGVCTTGTGSGACTKTLGRLNQDHSSLPPQNLQKTT